MTDWLIKEGRRPHTISTKLAILRSLFEYGRALGIFNLNPASAKLVPPPKKPKHSSGRALSPNEVKSLLSWFRLDSLLGARDYALMLITLRLSLRVSGVAGLPGFPRFDKPAANGFNGQTQRRTRGNQTAAEGREKSHRRLSETRPRESVNHEIGRRRCLSVSSRTESKMVRREQTALDSARLALGQALLKISRYVSTHDL